jgi:hypothetical protein
MSWGKPEALHSTALVCFQISTAQRLVQRCCTVKSLLQHTVQQTSADSTTAAAHLSLLVSPCRCRET